MVRGCDTRLDENTDSGNADAYNKTVSSIIDLEEVNYNECYNKSGLYIYIYIYSHFGKYDYM